MPGCRTYGVAWPVVGVLLLPLALFSVQGHADSASLQAQLTAALTRLDQQEAELAAQRKMLLELRDELAQRGVTPVAGVEPAASDEIPAAPEADARTIAAKAQQDDPTRDLLSQFPGAIPIPGTEAAFRIGGYAKTAYVQNYDPLQIQDKFVVGSIVTGDDPSTGDKAQTVISVSQSRLNLDLRQATDAGLMRAFIEGDFAGSNDTFRLRHAFGQWKRALAGKTWSTFMDTSATPEMIDFQGVNGQISVRQSQLRVAPQLTRLGREYEFTLGLEDPQPELTNGTGLSRVPDVIGSIRLDVGEQTHAKIALLFRQIRGDWDAEPGDTRKAFGWGLSVSGRTELPLFGAKDQLLFQLNGGNGIGRYVNDLGTIGGFDGVFSPTGQLELLDVYAGYVSAQHWWNDTVRSNLTLGFVDVDSPSFVPADFYKRTLEASVNLLWTPMPRLDVGGEFLSGSRDNVDGSRGTAIQVQMEARYLFGN